MLATFVDLHATFVDLLATFVDLLATTQELLLGVPPPLDLQHPCSVTTIMTHERDAVMASSIQSALGATGPCAVAVVGSDHVQGILANWGHPAKNDVPSTDNKTALPGGDQTHQHGHAATICVDSQLESQHIGVRRALLESVLRLQTQPAVLEDLETVLGPVADEVYEYYGATYELYGTTQMLLACAPSREDLALVCGGWRCDMWGEVLGAVRAVRPVQGGSAYAPELTLALRERAVALIL